MLVYGLEAAQNLTITLRDLRRTVKLLQSGLVILFPDETSGLQLLYSTLDRLNASGTHLSVYYPPTPDCNGRDT